MIVRQFLQWVRTAEAAERAEATSALARAYLYSDLSPDDRAAAEGAMILLLDDPSPLVRYALADVLGVSADAPAAIVHALINDQPDIAMLVVKLSETLASFVVARNWMEEDRAQRIAQEACEKATVILAAESDGHDIWPLVSRLRETGQLTAGLVLRSLLSCNIDFFEQSLAEVAQLPAERVSALLHDRRAAGFKAVYERAGLPGSVYPAFRAAIEAMHDDILAEPGGATRLKRRMVERVLTGCAGLPAGDVEPLMMLLRRYATEAAREEARLFCDERVETDNPVPANDTGRMMVVAA